MAAFTKEGVSRSTNKAGPLGRLFMALWLSGKGAGMLENIRRNLDIIVFGTTEFLVTIVFLFLIFMGVPSYDQIFKFIF